MTDSDHLNYADATASAPPRLYAYDCPATHRQPERVMLSEYKTKDTALRERAFVAASRDSLVPVQR